MANYLEVFSPRQRKDKTYWTRVGTAFPAKSGEGFSIEFDALPLPDREGRVAVIVRPPRPKDNAPASDGGARYEPLSDQLDDHVPF